MDRKYTHLSLHERVEIQLGIKEDLSLRTIARKLARSVSTISRELRRNGFVPAPAICAPHPPTARVPRGTIAGYWCDSAQARAERLARTPRRRPKLRVGSALFASVTQALKAGLSPQQISATLKRMPHPVRLSHETIYTTLYAMPRGQLRTEVLALLRQQHLKRRRRSQGEDRRRGSIIDMTSIEERPIEVLTQRLPGHWEGDLIKGAFNRSQVGTLIERSSLFTVLVALPQATAAATANAFIDTFRRIDAQRRLSLTYDQGKEMAHHAHLARQTGLKVYFAHPHSPWERGINENTNGLLRQYLPKRADLCTFEQRQLDEIAWKLNTRPRASLGHKCPAELFLPEGSFDFADYWGRKLGLIVDVAVGS